MRAGRPPKNGHAERPFRTLADVGISKRQSSEWQKLAEIPEAEFLAITRNIAAATGHPATTGGIIRAWHGAKARRVASLERMAEELRAAGWSVFPPDAMSD
jgi:uncharacterized protein YjiS (DUF1127 family)